MNSFTNAILSLMLGWIQTLLNAARDFISSDTSPQFFAFFRNNWRILFFFLCIGGFVTDKVIYLIRWRPYRTWFRRRYRSSGYYPQPVQKPVPESEYSHTSHDTLPNSSPELNDQELLYQMDENASAASEPAATMQYQMQSQPETDFTKQYNPPYTIPYNTPFVDSPAPQEALQPSALFTAPSPPYSTPQFSPERSRRSSPRPFRRAEYVSKHGQPQEQQDEQETSQQSFAFGMAPSFGSVQSEPTYYYPQQAGPTFAPPQYGDAVPPSDTFAPQQYSDHEQFEPEEAGADNERENNPNFQPFSERSDFSPNTKKTRGLGAVAKKARTLLNAENEYQSVSYQDLYSTVDVSKAFHSPVYPDKASEDEGSK